MNRRNFFLNISVLPIAAKAELLNADFATDPPLFVGYRFYEYSRSLGVTKIPLREEVMDRYSSLVAQSLIQMSETITSNIFDFYSHELSTHCPNWVIDSQGIE